MSAEPREVLTDWRRGPAALAAGIRENEMPKYLIEVSYTSDGVKGLLKEGGSGRRAAVQKLIESAGGTVESMYFVFGKSDAVIVCDLPDNATMAGVSLAVSAVGAARPSVRVLLTPDEIDAAAGKTVEYRAPGS
jgi:uncharacterized protein with GYD domain